MPAAEKDYESIPKVKRLAMFFAIIGPEGAAPVLRLLDGAQAEAVVRELADIELVDEATQVRVVEEFSTLLAEGIGSARGGRGVAMQTFEAAYGPARARSLAAKIGAPQSSPGIEAALSDMSAAQILSIFKSEQPQTIAYVLSAIRAERAAEVLAAMDEAARAEVVVCMAGLGPTPAELLEKVLGNVAGLGASATAPETLLKLGGAEHMAGVLKGLDATLGKDLLGAIEEADPVAGAAISKAMFSFRDLIDLAQDAMQIILREVDSGTMVVAMKSADPELLEKIYGSLSKRGAEALKEEFELQGPVRLKEVEAAQGLVLDAVRRLEESGQLSIGDGGDEYV